MTILDVIALFLGLVAALTMWGVALAIRLRQRHDPTMRTPGAKLTQALHLCWGVSVAVLAAAVVYG